MSPLLPQNADARGCTYCGGPASTRDHIVPRCFYPPSLLAFPTAPLLTVASCEPCNQHFSKYEADARSMLLMAGPVSNGVRELFFGKTLRGFERPQGKSDLMRLFRSMQPVATRDGIRQRVVPHTYPSVIHVLTKVVRGLSRHHGLFSQIGEDHVAIMPMGADLPDDCQHMLEGYRPEPTVFEYAFGILDLEDIHSVWRLTFYETRMFLGMITTEPNALKTSGSDVCAP